MASTLKLGTTLAALSQDGGAKGCSVRYGKLISRTEDGRQATVEVDGGTVTALVSTALDIGAGLGERVMMLVQGNIATVVAVVGTSDNAKTFSRAVSDMEEAKAGIAEVREKADATAAQADELAKNLDAANATITTVSDEVGALKTTVANAVEDAEGALETATEAKQTAEKVSSTAAQAYENASAALTRASSAEQTASELKTTVETDYLSKEDAGETYAAKSEVTQTATELRTEISEQATAAANTYATKTSLTQTASDLTVKITSAQSTADSASTAAKSAQSTANDAKKVATNYLSFSSNGLVVGDMTASSLGKNVRLTSSAMEVRNGSDVLASYGDSAISLGANSTASTIAMCGGTGNITATSNSAASQINMWATGGAYLTNISGADIGRGVGIVTKSLDKNGYPSDSQVVLSGTTYYVAGTDMTYAQMKARMSPTAITVYPSAATTMNSSGFTRVACGNTKVSKAGSDFTVSNGAIKCNFDGYALVSGAGYWTSAASGDLVQFAVRHATSATNSDGDFYSCGGNFASASAVGSATFPIILMKVTNGRFISMWCANWSSSRGTVPNGNDATQLTVIRLT